jgi:hypothetical protein
MNRAFLVLAAILALTFPAMLQADEIPLDSPIESIALFKNGLAVVRRSAQIPGPGVYRLNGVAEPVHGTFWIEGDVPVDAQVTMRETDAPEGSTIDFQQELVGRQVTIHFTKAGVPVATGKVVALSHAAGSDAWDREYRTSSDQYSYNGSYPMQPAGTGFLVLDTGHGRAFVSPSEIAFMECEDAGATTRQRVPVFLLTPRGDKKGTVHITYLTRGIAWAPAYRIDLTDDKTLTVEQQAVVKNELGDFKDAELMLISGYPNIRYAQVVSPLALSQNWAQFFSQMNANPAEFAAAMMNAAVAQSPAPNGAASGPTGIDTSATPEGEGVDLHYQSIGKRSMNEGDSLLSSVAEASSHYDRIVEWVVPDARDVDGRFVQPYESRTVDQTSQDQVWDAIQFRNPLSFPMTTAPAMIIDNGHFAGQQLSYWVNAGEQTTLHVSKALSVRVRADEQGDADATRGVVDIGGREFRKVSVTGTLSIANHRNQAISLIIRRQFSGDLVKADGDPKISLREEGVYSVNRRNELTWAFPMKAGEERTLDYQYTVLVAN